MIATLLAAAAATVAIAVPSQAQSPASCRLTVTDLDGIANNEVRAVELNEKVDDIFLLIDGQRFPASGTVSFSTAGQGRPASAFGNPSRVFNAGEEIVMKVVESDPVFRDNMGTNRFPCSPMEGRIPFNDGGKGAYNVEVRVEEI
jgi:hypothetical protein